MKLYIKYMVSIRCKMIVKEELKKLGIHNVTVNLGEVEIMENITGDQCEKIRNALLPYSHRPYSLFLQIAQKQKTY